MHLQYHQVQIGFGYIALMQNKCIKTAQKSNENVTSKKMQTIDVVYGSEEKRNKVILLDMIKTKVREMHIIT